jgi:hypothetical protein
LSTKWLALKFNLRSDFSELNPISPTLIESNPCLTLQFYWTSWELNFAWYRDFYHISERYGASVAIANKDPTSQSLQWFLGVCIVFIMFKQNNYLIFYAKNRALLFSMYNKINFVWSFYNFSFLLKASFFWDPLHCGRFCLVVVVMYQMIPWCSVQCSALFFGYSENSITCRVGKVPSFWPRAALTY